MDGMAWTGVFGGSAEMPSSEAVLTGKTRSGGVNGETPMDVQSMPHKRQVIVVFPARPSTWMSALSGHWANNESIVFAAAFCNCASPSGDPLWVMREMTLSPYWPCKLKAEAVRTTRPFSMRTATTVVVPRSTAATGRPLAGRGAACHSLAMFPPCASTAESGMSMKPVSLSSIVWQALACNGMPRRTSTVFPAMLNTPCRRVTRQDEQMPRPPQRRFQQLWPWGGSAMSGWFVLEICLRIQCIGNGTNGTNGTKMIEQMASRNRLNLL